jgi:hypothetical protein
MNMPRHPNEQSNNGPRPVINLVMETAVRLWEAAGQPDFFDLKVEQIIVSGDLERETHRTHVAEIVVDSDGKAHIEETRETEETFAIEFGGTAGTVDVDDDDDDVDGDIYNGTDPADLDTGREEQD